MRQYQEARRSMFEDSDKDKLGNLLVHPSCIDSLMRLRLKVGRAYRRWKRQCDKERLDWLQQHSYAFAHDAKTGKGFIRLSAAYLNEEESSYSLRNAIDQARRKRP